MLVKNIVLPSTIEFYADCPHCGTKIHVMAWVNDDKNASRKCPLCRDVFEVPPVWIEMLRERNEFDPKYVCEDCGTPLDKNDECTNDKCNIISTKF